MLVVYSFSSPSTLSLLPWSSSTGPARRREFKFVAII
jgi:hypothetical protein